ncbi:MAG: T9SS type A sorting domain-containing protein [Flavobacteriaceae bacterium]
MKKILLILFISLLNFQSYAQDPDLFRTWYLYHVYMDFDEPYDISDINPAIFPILTIEEDLSFTGEGACNTFNGSYEYLGGISLNALSFNNTNDDCGNQSHNSFENDYFGFLATGYEYTIIQENDGLTLRLDTPLMSGLTFKEFPLSINHNNFSEIKIYPNPTTGILYFSSEIIIDKITIYTITGKKILEQKISENFINIESISEGIYFIELQSNLGKIVKKFIKI